MNAVPGIDGRTRTRRYTWGEFLAALTALAPRLPDIAAIWLFERVDPRLREAVMLAVAEANACRYCLFAHTEWALAVGVDADEAAALGAGQGGAGRHGVAARWAAARAQSGFTAVAPEIEADFSATFATRERSDLDTIARVMTVFNRLNNTVEAAVARRSGRPLPDSRRRDEAFAGVLFALGAPPILLFLAILRRRSPAALIADFRRFRLAA